MKKKFGSFLFIISGSILCFAQQAVSTAGGEASGAGGTVSYTIGQVTYSNYIQNEGAIAEGVQQAYEILVISSSENKFGINLELSVYPNPTREYLKLKFVNYTTDNLTYQLYDINGKLLEYKKLDGVETKIQVDMLAPSIYYLKVINGRKEVKTFKIIKY